MALSSTDTMTVPPEPPPASFPFGPAGSPGLPTFADMENAGPDLQATILWSLGLLLLLATFFLALRMYCKFLRDRAYSFDDWLLVASWVGFPRGPHSQQALASLTLTTLPCSSPFQAVFLASTILSLALVGRGQGKHIWEIAPEILPTFALPGRITTTLQVVALAWSKTSFGVTLYNVVAKKTEKWLLIFSIISLNILLAVSALLPWVPCRPLE